MDTGWFRHNNTTPNTFSSPAILEQAGLTESVLKLFEQNTLGRLKLTGLVLRLQMAYEGQAAYTEIHRGDYAETGALPQDSEDLVNYTRSLAGVEVGLFFMEQPRGGVKVASVRGVSTLLALPSSLAAAVIAWPPALLSKPPLMSPVRACLAAVGAALDALS